MATARRSRVAAAVRAALSAVRKHLTEADVVPPGRGFRCEELEQRVLLSVSAPTVLVASLPAKDGDAVGLARAAKTKLKNAKNAKKTAPAKGRR